MDVNVTRRTELDRRWARMFLFTTYTFWLIEAFSAVVMFVPIVEQFLVDCRRWGTCLPAVLEMAGGLALVVLLCVEALLTVFLLLSKAGGRALGIPQDLNLRAFFGLMNPWCDREPQGMWLSGGLVALCIVFGVILTRVAGMAAFFYVMQGFDNILRLGLPWVGLEPFMALCLLLEVASHLALWWALGHFWLKRINCY